MGVACASAVQPITLPLPCFPGKAIASCHGYSSRFVYNIQRGAQLSEIACLNCAEYRAKLEKNPASMVCVHSYCCCSLFFQLYIDITVQKINGASSHGDSILATFCKKMLHTHAHKGQLMYM